MIQFGQFTFDAGRRQVLGENGEIVHLTRKAFELLAVLIEEAPRVVRKAVLHERLWPGTFVSDATLVSLVKELRKGLRDGSTASQLIRTSHGVGYAFCGALETGSRPSVGMTQWLIAGDRRLTLKAGVNVIGRDPSSDVWLDAAGVSRRHARIVIADTVAQLEDLGSKNGTTVRDSPLVEPTVLRDGDRILIGPIAIVYRADSSGMSTATVVRHDASRT